MGERSSSPVLVTSHRSQHVTDVNRLDAFGHNSIVELVGHGYHRRYNRGIFGFADDLARQRTVDLQIVRGQAQQVGQIAVTAAKVVNGMVTPRDAISSSRSRTRSMVPRAASSTISISRSFAATL